MIYVETQRPASSGRMNCQIMACSAALNEHTLDWSSQIDEEQIDQAIQIFTKVSTDSPSGKVIIAGGSGFSANRLHSHCKKMVTMILGRSLKEG